MERSSDKRTSGMADVDKVQAGEEPPIDSLATLKIESESASETANQRLVADDTKVAPIASGETQVQTWLSRAATATTYEERLVCLSQAANLAPEQSTVRQWIYETLKPFLNRKPFLRYVQENPILYHISTADGHTLTVPKDRTVSPPYPPTKPTPLRPAFRWLRLALLGLLIAGLGTLVCAPISAWLAWSVSQHSTDASQQKHARTVMVYAILLWFFGLILSGLFLLHLYGYR